MQDSSELLRRLHEIYQGPLPEGAPIRTPDQQHDLTFLFRDVQPGTAEFARLHYPKSAAYIERWDGVGPEDFGPVELLDREGRHVRNVEHPRP